jgi:hypothetical protein
MQIFGIKNSEFRTRIPPPWTSVKFRVPRGRGVLGVKTEAILVPRKIFFGIEQDAIFCQDHTRNAPRAVQKLEPKTTTFLEPEFDHFFDLKTAPFLTQKLMPFLTRKTTTFRLENSSLFEPKIGSSFGS